MTEEEGQGRLSVPVHTVCQEELSNIYTKGYEVVPEIPRYDNVKARLCAERRTRLDTEYNPDHGSKTVFQEEVLRLENTFSFLQIYHTDDSRGGEGRGGDIRWGITVNFYLESEFPFYTACLKIVRGNSLSCIVQTSIFRSTSNEHDITTCHCWLTLLKFVFFLVLKIMKVNFEAAVVSGSKQNISRLRYYWL